MQEISIFYYLVICYVYSSINEPSQRNKYILFPSFITAKSSLSQSLQIRILLNADIFVEWLSAINSTYTNTKWMQSFDNFNNLGFQPFAWDGFNNIGNRFLQPYYHKPNLITDKLPSSSHRLIHHHNMLEISASTFHLSSERHLWKSFSFLIKAIQTWCDLLSNNDKESNGNLFMLE